MSVSFVPALVNKYSNRLLTSCAVKLNFSEICLARLVFFVIYRVQPVQVQTCIPPSLANIYDATSFHSRTPLLAFPSGRRDVQRVEWYDLAETGFLQLWLVICSDLVLVSQDLEVGSPQSGLLLGLLQLL